jgi:hypothetical protein
MLFKLENSKLLLINDCFANSLTLRFDWAYVAMNTEQSSKGVNVHSIGMYVAAVLFLLVRNNSGAFYRIKNRHRLISYEKKR